MSELQAAVQLEDIEPRSGDGGYGRVGVIEVNVVDGTSIGIPNGTGCEGNNPGLDLNIMGHQTQRRVVDVDGEQQSLPVP